MLKLLLLLLSTVFITHAELVLQPKYTYTDETIYSTDLFKEVPKFKLFLFSTYKKIHSEPTETIVEKFKKHAISINTNGLDYIVFEKHTDINTTGIEHAIRKYYKQHYPTITIKHIELTPSGIYDSLPNKFEVSLSRNAYKKDDGSCYLKTKRSKKRYYFRYKIDATIDVLVARTDIGRNVPITKFNTVMEPIKFKDSNYKPYLYGSVTYIAKHVIKKGAPITYREIKAQPMVQKNQSVTVIIKDGSLVVEFSAKANENGFLHDIISLTKSDGKRFKAQVIGPGRVILE